MNPFLSQIIKLDRERSNQPALTWYGDDGRIELSGRVYSNWVIKTLNLLLEECDVEPGSLVTLPPVLHWKTLIIAHAALAAGAEISFTPRDDADCDVIIDGESSRPGHHETLVVALPSLALQAANAPVGSLDWTQVVRNHSDAIIFMPIADPNHDCWPGLTYGAASDWLNSPKGARESGNGVSENPAPEVSDSSQKRGRLAVSNAGTVGLQWILLVHLRNLHQGGSLVLGNSDLSDATLKSEQASLFQPSSIG